MKISSDNLNLTEARAKRPDAGMAEGLKADALKPDALKPDAGKLSETALEPGFRAALKLAESRGFRLDDRSLQSLRDFMLNGEGSVEDKLEAVETALAKDMPLKEALLSRLQGFSAKSLLDFLPEPEGGNPLSTTAAGQEGRKTASLDERSISRTNERHQVQEGRQAQKSKQEQVQERQRIQKSEQMQERHQVFEEHGPEAQKRRNTLEKLDELMRELLEEIEPRDGEHSDVSVSDLELLTSYLAGAASINENFSYRALMMTEITPRLQGLKQDFENLKKVLAQDLVKLTTSDKPLGPEEAVKTLEKNIDRLDRAIMRSEMSLYMDLKGEKELLKLSSRLQEARTLLQEGRAAAAKETLADVLKTLEKLDYNPSVKKALLLYDGGFEHTSGSEIRNMKELAAWLGDRAGRYPASEGTAVSLSTYLRKLGLGAEAENFEHMSLQRQKNQDEARDFISLKSLLRELSDCGAKPQDRTAANAMLGRIEALDLKNKILDTAEAQTLSLDIPLKLNGGVKNVKVFIQSPQHQRKLDWENFNMFFVVSTEKMGELGIKVESLQRNLSVSILNDKAKKMEEDCDFKASFKTEVEELGFRLVKMIMEEWRERGLKRQKALHAEAGPVDQGRGGADVSMTLEEGRFDMRL